MKSQLENEITTLLIDIYGVLHEGGSLFPNVIETLQEFKKNYNIIIISNASAEGNDVVGSLSKKGLIKGEHYDSVITSGDVFLDEIRNKPRPMATLYTEFKPFDKYKIEKIAEISEAEHVYIGIPKNDKGEDIKLFDLIEEGENLMDFIKNSELDFIDKYLPNLRGKKVYCANADLMAVENGHIVVRQGFVGLYLKHRGVDVEFFGKPFPTIFEKALAKHKVNPENALMIGDQYSTDLGCYALGINTALINSKVTELTREVVYFEDQKSCEPNITVNHISELRKS